MYLGVHVSISGGISHAIDLAQDLGCTAMQMFSRNPRAWRHSPLAEEDVVEFRRRRRRSGVKVVALHIPYLINLATSYDVLRKNSQKAFIEDLREADALGADYLVTHMGSFKNSTEAEGLKQLVKALNVILAATRGVKVKLLLENTAGSGSWLGSTFKHHRFIFERISDRRRLGLCLDTAHLFASGSDIRKPSVLNNLLSEIDRKLGKRALRMVHLNDSMTALGSRIDRHENIGFGCIGLKGIRGIVNHRRLRDLAFVLETPKRSEGDDRKNLNRVRGLLRRQVRRSLGV